MHSTGYIGFPDTLTVDDDRIAVTQDEADAIERMYLRPDGTLSRIPARQKHKLVILRRLAARFSPGRRYSQVEVNGLLAAAHPDYAELRRWLVDYGFMRREPDGSSYWLP